jgi:hypothetical protein
MPIAWDDYLGHKLTDESLKQLWCDLKVEPDMADSIKIYKDGTTYYCFYNAGLALSFTGDNKVFDSIDFYKNSPPYSRVDVKYLPESIAYSATAKELVQKFGEPLEKGGGGSSRVDIWLRWPSFQVDIPSCDWDNAKDIEWTSLTYFTRLS